MYYLKKLTCKISFLVLVTVLLAQVISVPVYAKSRVSLSKARVTIKTGKSVTLKVNGFSKKVKWSVSGKKLVTVNPKGKKRLKAVIKAKNKTGTCMVIVKAGKKTLKCKVTVKRNKTAEDPEEFKEKPFSESSIDITDKFKRQSVQGLASDENFISKMTGLSFSMLKILNQSDDNDGKNILISPDSILTAMAMAQNGAEGNTLKEMESAFGLNADELNAYLYTLNSRLTSSKSVNYHLADSIWYRKGEISVKDAFLQKNVDYFGAQVYEAPFDNVTLTDINNWVYNNTRGMIPGILDRLDKENVMILLNAIAFEGMWENQFDPRRTDVQKAFRDDSGNFIQNADYMNDTESSYLELKQPDGDIKAKGFIKPYEGGKIAFLGLEPAENVSLNDFINDLDPTDYVNAYMNKTDKYDVIIKMPKFSYDFSTSLVDTLKKLEIKDAFDENAADFSKMAALKPDETLSISDVLHKTHIEVDEDGTKAAAVTAVIVDKASAAYPPNEKQYVNLDHPFIYAIIDTKTGIPLFLGTVRAPN